LKKHVTRADGRFGRAGSSAIAADVEMQGVTMKRSPFELILVVGVGLLVLGILPDAGFDSGYQSSRPMLDCRPHALLAAGTLTLRFAFPHPGELAVRGPDGTWYFLVYDRK
jgi:hypothetical protein